MKRPKPQRNHCCRCGTYCDEIDIIGTLEYGERNAPFLCVKCTRDWMSYAVKIDTPILHRDWRKYFEKWLGYHWKGFPKEVKPFVFR
jgi:hypothetical protein